MSHLTLSPLGAQVVAGSESMGIATACDVVCYHRDTKQYCVIEVKTGGSSYYFKCSKVGMNVPFNGQTDCVYNQHQLQLWLTTHLYQLTYPTHQVMGSVLLRLFPEGFETYPLEPWITKHAQQALCTICKQ
jgi:hypothetical protein